MRNSDDARLVLGGQEFTGWTGVSIRMAIDTLADSFTLSAPYNPEDTRLVAAFEPFKYQPVKIFIGDDLYHSGRIDGIAFSLTDKGRVMSLSGRSLSGILCDCSIGDYSQIESLTFAAIARKLCAPFGIKIRADADTKAIEITRPEYGQTVFDFLHSLAAPHNLLLNSSYSGELVISSGDSLMSKLVVATLAEGDPRILEISATFDGTRRFSRYTISTQFAGEPDITGSVTDPAISLYRPIAKSSGETDNDPTTTAARLAAECIAQSLAISVKLSGWRRPDGKLWAERQAVTLRAPSARLLKPARYIISDVSLSLDPNEGRTVSLSLTPPEVYNVGLIKAKKASPDLW